MLVLIKDFTTGQVTSEVFDEPSITRALKIMRRMRWAYVTRHGRRGNRWYTVTPRNPSEWKRGYVEIDGYLATIAPR